MTRATANDDDPDFDFDTDPLAPIERTATCGRCGDSFTFNTLGLFTFRPAKCPSCAEREAVTDAALQRQAEAEAAARTKSEREYRILEYLERAGANPAEHGRSTLENFDDAEAGQLPVKYARRFVEEARAASRYDPVKGIYVHGGTGAGKTHIAVAVMRDLLMDPAFTPTDVVFDHAAELMARIQNTYGGKGDTFELLEHRFNARVWILDDLGTERSSDDVARHLTLIFTRRALRPTLVTSNLSPEQLNANRPELGRVTSRLGPAYFRYCEVRGRDRRFN